MSAIMLTLKLNFLMKNHERVTFWQEEVEIPEQSSNRLQRVGRSAHATKVAKSTTMFTTIKAVVPKTVGLPKPPQKPGNVR
jgi:hypothetical protein